MDEKKGKYPKSDEERKIENNTPEKNPEEEFERPISSFCEKIPRRMNEGRN
jgi:hypothetical protein